MTDTTNALTIPTGNHLETIFRQQGGVDPIIARIQAEVRSTPADTTTRKGRDAIASLARRVSTAKVMLDDAGKSLTEAAKKEIAIVDAARKKIRDTLDELRDEARKPLTDWEAAEKAKTDHAKATIDKIRNHGVIGDESSADIRARAEEIKAIEITPGFGEFEQIARQAMDATLTHLRAAYAMAKGREDQEAENARLREEIARLDAERIEAERIQREKDEAARVEAERLASEAAAKLAAEHAEAEAKRIAAETAARVEAEKAKAAETARLEAERLAEARREADRIATEARELELRRQIEAAKIETERAAQAERDRVEADRVAAETTRLAREADVAHRLKIAAEIANDLRAMAGHATPELIAEALMEGRISHCTVRI